MEEFIGGAVKTTAIQTKSATRLSFVERPAPTILVDASCE